MNIEKEGFWSYLEELGNKKEIKKSVLCHGICSPSLYTDFLNGKKRLGKSKQDRIMERLGIGGNDISYLVNVKEYECIKMQQTIVLLIIQRKLEEANERLEAFVKKYCKTDQICLQFYYAMKGFIYKCQKREKCVIYEQFKQAVQVTMKDFDVENIAGKLYGVQELDMVLEMLWHDDNLSSKDFEKLIEYIMGDLFDKKAKAKLLPKACVYYLKSRQAEVDDCSVDEFEIQKSMNYFEYALEKLRDLKLGMYLWEVLENLKEIYEKLEFDKAGKTTKLYEKFASVTEWKEALERFYLEYKEPFETEETTILYVTHNVSCINDVIESRRKMKHLTVENMAEDSCNRKTVYRLKDKKANSQTENVKPLLEKVDYPEDYTNYYVGFNNIKTKQLLDVFLNELRSLNFKAALFSLHQLKKEIDDDNEYTIQMLDGYEAYLMYNCGMIDLEEAHDRISAALKRTVLVEDLFEGGVYKLTDNELSLINLKYNVLDTNGNEVRECMWIKEYAETMIDEGEILNREATLLLLLTCSQTKLGNNGYFESSNDCCKKANEIALYNKIFVEVPAMLYAMWWNANEQKKAAEINEDLSQLQWILSLAKLWKQASFCVHLNNKIKQIAIRD